MKRFLRFLAFGLLALVVVGAGLWAGRYELMRWQFGLPAYTHAPGETRSEMVAMRDGVRLATDIHLPEAPDGAANTTWPTVLIRNPYDVEFVASWCGIFVRFGFACVLQDVRGQMDSEGEWTPMLAEPKDGEDAIAWLVEQPFVDGNIGLYGPSYLASVQWAAASRGFPPEVKTMVPFVFGTDLYSLAYERGMFRHEILTAWAALMPGRGFNRENAQHYQASTRHRPAVDMDEAYFGQRLDWFREYLTQPSRGDALWNQEELLLLRATPPRVDIPVMLVGGWYDIFLEGQLDDWSRLGSRARSKFVIGPWTHIQQPGGDLDLPDGRGAGWQWQLVLDWMGHHLRGEPLDQPTGVVESYAFGEDRWYARAQWPPEHRPTRFHLDAVGDAHGCDGGRLLEQAPQPKQAVTYTYDPDDPVPMRGGAGSLAFIIADGGPAHSVEQGTLCERPDVLSFATPPLSEPMRIAGPIRALLSVSSDAPDTAFTAKLVEVKADGRAYNVRDGITSLEFREGEERSLAYTPGDVVETRIDLWPIEWVFEAGSRLRLDVSSSNFPAYHAHPNRAGVWAMQAEAVPAQQTLHVGAGRPGFLELPVAPLDVMQNLASHSAPAAVPVGE